MISKQSYCWQDTALGRARNSDALSNRSLAFQLGPVDQFESSIVKLDQSGTAFYPVTGVAILDAVHIPQVGTMDMTAYQAIDTMLVCS